MGVCCAIPKIVSVTTEKTPVQAQTASHNIRLSTIKPYILKHQNSLSQNNLSSKVKTESDLVFITKALRSHFVFSNLSDIDLKDVAQKTNFYVYSKDETIFKQGQVGNNFYVIASGKVEVHVNSKKVNILKSGCTFGELAILHSTKRTATVTALTKVELWGLHRKEFLDVVKFISSSNYQEIQNFISNLEIFDSLSKVQKSKLAGNFVILKYNPGFKIFKEGEVPESLYLIESGLISCQCLNGETKTLKKTDHFGDDSISFDSSKFSAVTAIDSVRCLAISKNKISKILGKDLQSVLFVNTMRKKMKLHPFFSEINSDMLESLSFYFKFRHADAGTVLIKSGEKEMDCFYIIIKGSITGKLTRNDYGDFFGDFGSICTAAEDVVCEQASIIGYFFKPEFEKVCGCDFQVFRNSLYIINVFKNLYIFKHLPEETLISLSKVIIENIYEDDEVIIQENTDGDSILILVSGKVDIYKNNTLLRTLTKHDYFGERAIINNFTRTATVKAKGKTTCWVIKKEDFMRINDESIMRYFKKRIDLQDEEIKLSDLEMIRKIGQGAFGSVFLVQHKQTETNFALKAIDKDVILSYEIEENILMERNILRTLDHEFIMKLVKSFKDPERVYFLLEYVPGMTLYDVSLKLSIFSCEDAKFYVSCILLVLNYIHERDIVYRDLKPENILIDLEGYPKLIDFGTAKILQDRTYTVLGTPHYMAPEIILFKGYGIEVDYWALGILLYEMVFGVVPYGHDKDDPYEIFQCVLEKNLRFPEVRNEFSIRALISQLLSQSPSERIVGGYDKIIKHSWFEDTNFVSLISKEVKAPFLPGSLLVERSEGVHDFFGFIEKEAIPKNGLRERTKPVADDWDEYI